MTFLGRGRQMRLITHPAASTTTLYHRSSLLDLARIDRPSRTNVFGCERDARTSQYPIESVLASTLGKGKSE